jgi:N-glycosylase/DNA lyase
VAWHLGLDDGLRPFYVPAASDRVLSASIEYNVAAKGKPACSMCDGLIRVVLAQNTAFRRLYAMRAKVAAAFGDPFEVDGRIHHAAPTPEQLAAASLRAIRATKVGYRDRFIKAVAQAVVGGLDLDAIKQLPSELARPELMKLPGVGPYPADPALIIGARRSDVLFLDAFIREALRQFYFGGAPVADARLPGLAQSGRPARPWAGSSCGWRPRPG